MGATPYDREARRSPALSVERWQRRALAWPLEKRILTPSPGVPWSWILAPWGASGLDCASRCPFGWCLVSSGFPAFAVCSLGSVLASKLDSGCWALPGLGSGFLMLPGLALLTTLSDFGRKGCRTEELDRTSYKSRCQLPGHGAHGTNELARDRWHNGDLYHAF